MKLKVMLATALGAMSAIVAAGDLSVAPYFQDHMVLQRGKQLTVWGKDAAGRTVTVSFAGQTATATTGSGGLWEATFAQPPSLSSVSQTLTVSDNASESVTISDILVGDVYLCSGQSNMHFMLWEDYDAVKNFCSAAGDGVRAIHVPENQSNSAAYDLPQTTSFDKYGTRWGSCVEEGIRTNITCVGLNFACYLRAANSGVPIGIVQAAFRGAGIDGFRVGHLIWNSMMAPYAKAQFCGVLWYQGESNAGMTADAYAAALHALVVDWRSVWGNDLPFYAVQIATPGAYYGASVTDAPPVPTTVESQWNYTSIREGLRLWDEIETGAHDLAVICDFVECLQNNDLHPHDKNTVGRRLSFFALRDIYGQTALQANGPKYDAAVVNADGSVTVSFKSGTATGLTAGKVIQCSGTTLSSWTSTTDPVKGFALKGTDGIWRTATATISGSTVVLTAEGISAVNKAVQFHYGYWNFTRDDKSNDGQRMTLYNSAGLPLSPIAPQDLTGGTGPVDPPVSTVATPTFSPASCSFFPSTNVVLSCATEGAVIRYTLDGTTPTATSTLYSAPIAISATTTVKVRAFADGMNASVVASATYTYVEPPQPGAKPFYIGETGYDSWSDAYNAAQNGATIKVGVNATMAISGGKTVTIDLAGGALNWEASGYTWGIITVVDSVGGGLLTLEGYSRNVSGATVDLSVLTADQLALAGAGLFWTSAATVLKFPSGMALAECTSRLGNKDVGQKIVVQGVTYTWDGTTWKSEGKSYPAWIDSTSQTLAAKYDAWVAKFNVADPTAAQKDAYLLNCANTAETVAAAKAAFTVVSIAVNADGTVDVGLPTAPDGGFNGTVAIMGCETVNGTYHAVTTGSVLAALYRVPAASNDRFFKASMDIQ